MSWILLFSLSRLVSFSPCIYSFLPPCLSCLFFSSLFSLLAFRFSLLSFLFACLLSVFLFYYLSSSTCPLVSFPHTCNSFAISRCFRVSGCSFLFSFVLAFTSLVSSESCVCWFFVFFCCNCMAQKHCFSFKVCDHLSSSETRSIKTIG